MENTTNNLPALPETFKPEVFKKLIDQAPDIYQNSKQRVITALEVGKKLDQLATTAITSDGQISDALDERLSKYLANINKARKEINEARSPVTNMFGAVVKLYTSLEGMMDIKGDTTPAKIQKIRNAYAEFKAKEQRLKDAALAMEKNIAQERITIRTEVEKQMQQAFIDYLVEKKKSLYDLFNATTLDNYNINFEILKKFDNKYPESHYLTIEPVVQKIYLADNDVKLIVKEFQDISFYAKNSGQFTLEINALKTELMEKMPGKKAELEAIANAKEESEKLRLQKEKEQREADEAEKLKSEQQTAKQQAVSQADANKQALSANVLFDLEAANAVPATTAKTKESYEIEVTNPSGFLQIVSFYFQKEGLSKNVEELQRKTLAQMVTFCQNYYTKHDEKIESPFIKYNKVIKALNK